MVGRRGIQKQQQCLGCLFGEQTTAQGGFKEPPEGYRNPTSALIMSPHVGKRSLTHFDIIQEKNLQISL